MASKTLKIEPVSKLYAKAIFELAQEKGATEQILADFSELVALFNEQPVLDKALSAYMFSVVDREILGKEILVKLGAHPILTKLIQLLISKNRLSLLRSVYEAFRLIVDSSQGIVRGAVSVVEPLTDAEMADLSRAFGRKLNKQVVLEPQINKEILGGLVVQVEGKTFDGSLKTAIRRLKENLERQSI